MRLGLIIAAFAALTVAAVAGWTRHPSPAPVTAANTAVPCVEQSRPAQVYNEPPSQPRPQSTAPAVSAVTPFGSAYTETYAIRYAPYQSELQPPPPPPQERVVEYRYVPVRRSKRVVYYRRVRHHRPFSHSAAIVAGSAGAGAAIGAVAGGGKGAGIGAVAGGAGGLIYDRLTH